MGPKPSLRKSRDETTTVSATERMVRARAARDDRVEEVVYLLAALSHRDHPLYGAHSHLAPVKYASATNLMNFVLCVHIRFAWDGGPVTERRLAWIISDLHKDLYFSDLEVRACGASVPRVEKMRLLAQLEVKELKKA